MDALLPLLQTYGLALVFVAVLLDQGGLPLPSYPIVAVAAALHHDDPPGLFALMVLVTAAGLLADTVWYVAGRRYVTRLLDWVCRLSLSPDSCVSGARGSYQRLGPASLVAAKFVPGFAALATALAGQARLGAWRFAFWDGLGCLLWGGSAVLLGVLFADALQEALDTLMALGRGGLLLVVAVAGVYLGGKAWQRQRFLREIRMARIGVDELAEMIEAGQAPLVLDVRPRASRERDGGIPGTIGVDDPKAIDLPGDRDVVVYCACPNEASAAVLAKALMARGVRRVRPLRGGLAAWRERGFAIVPFPAPLPSTESTA